MSSPFETLSKILALEKQREYDNKAVLGGLGRLSDTWAPGAIGQVNTKEERLIIEEVAGLLRKYSSVNEQAQRAALIEDMLNRISRITPSPAKGQVAAEGFVKPVERVENVPDRPKVVMRDTSQAVSPRLSSPKPEPSARPANGSRAPQTR